MREYPSSRIDFRSDTVTQPTRAMREAMHQAPVGDDVLGDDPTVLALQDRVAALFGKEAGLFVASGTMSNAIALRTHTVPGDEIVCDKTAHIYRYEGGGYAALCGASIALVDGWRTHDAGPSSLVCSQSRRLGKPLSQRFIGLR